MDHSIKVRILHKEYSLRVNAADIDRTQEMADYLDTRIRAFLDAHPDQSDITAAIITALAVTDELYSAQAALQEIENTVSSNLEELHDTLDAVVSV